MPFTYNEIIDDARVITHRNPNSDVHTNLIKKALRYAIDEASGFTEWWFVGVELKMTLTAGQRLYDLPVADAAGNVIPRVQSFNKQSFRTATRRQIDFSEDPTALDQRYPTWTDASVNQGTMEIVTVSNGQIATWRTPNAAFVASNPSLYFRGWRSFKYPDDDNADLPDFADTIADIPLDWHRILLPGTIKWVYRQARSKAWKDAHAEFRGDLKDMQVKCEIDPGFALDHTPPASVFRVHGNEFYDQRSDYGVFYR